MTPLSEWVDSFASLFDEIRGRVSPLERGDLERLIRAVQAEEREACAVQADDLGQFIVAAAIRARCG